MQRALREVAKQLIIILHWLVISSVNCEICSRLVFIRKSKCIPKC